VYARKHPRQYLLVPSSLSQIPFSFARRLLEIARTIIVRVRSERLCLVIGLAKKGLSSIRQGTCASRGLSAIG
jgi:hypothetical protein